MLIRPMKEPDVETVWNMLKQTFRAGDTYAVDPDISREDALALWTQTAATYVVETDAGIVGTYYIKTNKPGGGAHVCNCGYITSPAARGQGVAAAMCAHSLEAAKAL